MSSKKKSPDVKPDKDLDLSYDFNSSAFDDDLGGKKVDRTPISDFGQGIKQGIFDSIFKPELLADRFFIEKTIKAILPNEYGAAAAQANSVIGDAIKLYDKAARELDPVLKEAKKTASKVLLPSAGKFLPKSVEETLKEWGKDRSSPQIDPQESTITAAMSQIFGAVANNEAKERLQDRAIANARADQATKQHYEAISYLDQIRVSTNLLASYQQNVGVNFHRKSLELQYRQYFALASLLDEQRKSNAAVAGSLAAIRHNTALPDYVKMTEGEFLKKAMRNKFIDNVTQHLVGRNANFVRNMGRRISEKALDKVRNFGDALTTGLSGIEMGAEVVASAGDMGQSGHGAIGGMIGGALGDAGVKAAGMKLGSALKGKVGNNQRVQRGADWLGYFGDKNNTARLIKQWAEKGSDNALINELMQMVMEEQVQKEAHLDRDNLSSLNKPSPFTNQAHRSITEVIPGYLARIFRELQVIRTGDTSVDLTTFDFTRSSWVGETTLKNALVGKMFSKGDKDILNTQAKDVMDLLDPDNSKLSPEARNKLLNMIMKDNVNENVFDRDRLTNKETYSGEMEPHAEELSKFFSDYFGDETGRKQDFGAGYKKHRDLLKVASKLGTHLTANLQYLQDMQNTGFGKTLVDAGLVDENGRFNQEAYLQAQFHGQKTLEQEEILGGLGTGGFGGRGRGGRSGRNIANKVEIIKQPVKVEVTNLAALAEAIRSINGSPAGTSSAGSQSAVNDGFSSSVVDILKENSVKSEVTQIRDTLITIGSMLSSGVHVYNVSVDQIVNGDALRERAAWWNKSIKNTVSGAYNAAKGFGSKYLDKLKTFGASTIGTAKNAFRTGADLFKGRATGSLNDRFNGLKEWWKEADIYIGNEESPRLTYAQIKTGEYVDKNTGHVISSVTDITGEVRHRVTGAVFITDEEAATAYAASGTKRKLLSAISKLKTIGSFMIGQGRIDAIKMAKDTAATGLKYAKSFTTRLLDEPVDIYLKDHLSSPVMTAIMMRAGNYRSRKTGGIIYRPSEIDGVIVDAVTGNVVLSEDQLAQGIVDMDGRPIRTGFFDLLKRKLGNFAKATKDKIVDLAKNGMDMFSGLLKGWGGPEKVKGKFDISFGTKRTNELLVEIRDILDERLNPGRKRRKNKNGQNQSAADREIAAPAASEVGGVGGAGPALGIGNYARLLRERALSDRNKEKLDKAAAAVKERKERVQARIQEVRDAREARAKARAEQRAERDVNRRSKLAVAGEAVGKALRPRDNAMTKGIRSGTKALAGGVGSAIAGGAGFVGNAANAGLTGVGEASGGLLSGLIGGAGGRIAGGAATAALGGLGTAAGGLISGAGSVLGGAASLGISGVGYTLAAIGSVLSAPVVLGAAAVAAVGTAGYLGYKWFKNRLGLLDKVRFAQYGFQADQNEYWSKVRRLEDACKPGVSYDEGGTATLTDKDVKIKDIAESFGVRLDSRNEVKNFLDWFKNRFKPVYLTHMTALNKTKQKADLGDVDSSLSAEEKLKYLRLVEFKDGPYNVTTSPAPELKELTANGDTVAATFKEALATIEKDQPSKKEGESKPSDKPVNDNKPKEAGVGGLISSANAATIPAGVGVLAAAGKNDTAAASGGGNNLVVDAANTIPNGTGGPIDALSCIRYKAYGLNEMDSSKIQAIAALEEEIGKRVLAVKDGRVEYLSTGDRNTRLVDSLFGGKEAKQWFFQRFMPVYSAYAVGIHAVTGRRPGWITPAALSQLKKNELLTIAQNVISATVSKGPLAGTSVWSVKYSPWTGYSVNTDRASTDDNINFLKETSKLETEQKKSIFESIASSMKSGIGKAYQAVSDFVDDIKDSAKAGFAAAKQTYTDARAGGSSIVGAATSAVGAGASAAATEYSLPHVRGADAKKQEEAFKKNMVAMGITDPTEQAMLMAQVIAETGGFKNMEENLNYKPGRMAAVWPNRYAAPGGGPNQKAMALASGGIKAIANDVYGGRMGNKPGTDDGFNFRGRGAIQLTGRSNYEAVARGIGVDIVSNPDLLVTDPDVSAKASIWYWMNEANRKGVRKFAQAGDVKSVSGIINTGDPNKIANHLDVRENLFKKYLPEFKNSPVKAENAEGGTGAAATATAAPGVSNAAPVGGVNTSTQPSDVVVPASNDNKPASVATPPVATIPAGPAAPTTTVTSEAPSSDQSPAVPPPALPSSIRSATGTGYKPAQVPQQTAADIKQSNDGVNFTPLVDLGTKQLETQIEMRDLLRQILVAVSGNTAQASNANAGGDTAVPSASSGRSLQKLPRPVIDVSKRG
jgi:predicted chitinase